MRACLAATFAGLWIVAAASCSNKPSTPTVGPTSGVDPGDDVMPRYLTDLTLSERKKLCDWTAAIAGGYGTSVVCDSGQVVTNFATQEDCLDSFLGGCSTVTVTDWEQCRDKEVTDLCANFLYTAPECDEVVHCLGMTDGGPAPEPEGGADGSDGGG